MKINDVNRTLQSTDAQATSKSTGTARADKTTGATAAVGSVNISEASRSLQTAGTSNAESPFDAKRVDAIKAAISAGQFKVDPEAIADKVISSASQLLVGQA